MRKGILFDLDGTLWDSGEGVAVSWNLALARMNRPERLDAERVHGLMGKTGAEIAALLFPQEPTAEAERMLTECLNEENAYLALHGGTLFPGLADTMRTLRERGFFLGIVSNCQEGYIEAFIRSHALEGLFDDTECYGRTGQGKGRNIRLVAERNRLSPVLYLGDTQGDLDAAEEAGVPFLHAAYGFGTVPEGTDGIDDLRSLPDWVSGHFPGGMRSSQK